MLSASVECNERGKCEAHTENGGRGSHRIKGSGDMQGMGREGRAQGKKRRQTTRPMCDAEVQGVLGNITLEWENVTWASAICFIIASCSFAALACSILCFLSSSSCSLFCFLIRVL